VLILVAAMPRSPSAVPDWDFLIDEVPSWQAADDVGLWAGRRTG
jgi:hypothetical protein